jgi:hypothetical protein
MKNPQSEIRNPKSRRNMPTPRAPKRKPTKSPAPTFTFADGTTVRLRGIPPLMFVSMQSTTDRPQPPKRIVRLAGGGVQEVPRQDDEPLLSEEEIAALADPQRQAEERAYRQYRLALAQWEVNAQYRIARTLFLMGVEDGPPAEDVALLRAIGFSDPYDLKYAWLASKLTDEAEIERFYEAVIGLSIPTEKGLAEARALFQGAVARGDGGLAGAGALPGAPAGAAEGQEG